MGAGFEGPSLHSIKPLGAAKGGKGLRIAPPAPPCLWEQAPLGTATLPSILAC